MLGVKACLQAGKWMPETEHEAGQGPQRSRINRCSLVNETQTNKHMKKMSIDCLAWQLQMSSQIRLVPGLV